MLNRESFRQSRVLSNGKLSLVRMQTSSITYDGGSAKIWKSPLPSGVAGSVWVFAGSSWQLPSTSIGYGGMIRILEQHGIYVKKIKTDKPGYVVYEDDWQLVAEPFRKGTLPKK